ncbi:5'-methylthioadenosine/S-adenosylhomocysteine nucleosidase [Nonomuraea endophytica]|uniref:Nucleoside phosphorylase n=1 Tax=Nonomuraea endophytica TaxID=714136 RepID=A0A7W8EL56_9ACTN|nr:5'-methylthioadenosine/S-adenosylhomocysteine nucleosidase [Nonomuraea endophytica]MBB5083306.1 nucleoside phosphorylase [Nonomuraea endophytica]
MTWWQGEDGSPRDLVVVLTALPLEADAVRRLMRDVERRVHPSGTVFSVGELPGVRTKVVLGITGEGTKEAAVITERAIETFRPAAVLLVGVAGALKDSVGLGDVVVAKRVHCYSGGKETAETFKSRPRTWDAAHRLLMLTYDLDVDWPDEPPKVHHKPIASGDTLLTSRRGPLAAMLDERFEDAVAIEMEGAGVAIGAHLRETNALAIRGISDRADEHKQAADAGGSQERAAANAAAFAVALIAAYAATLKKVKKAKPVPGHPGGEILAARLAGSVTSLCFGPGRTLLAAALSGPIRRWRLDDGEELPPIHTATWMPPRYGVRVAASPGGGPVVVRDGYRLRALQPDEPDHPPVELGSVTYPGELYFASTASYALLSWATIFRLRSTATGADLLSFTAVAASISADESTLAVAKGLVSGGRHVQVYRLRPGQDPVPTGPPIELHQAAGMALQIALSPDGTLLGGMTARWAGVFDVERGVPIMPRSGGGDLWSQFFPEAMSLVCTPRGRLLHMSKGRVLQLDVNSRDDAPFLPGGGGYRRLVMSPDGLLATGDAAGWVRVRPWQD